MVNLFDKIGAEVVLLYLRALKHVQEDWENKFFFYFLNIKKLIKSYKFQMSFTYNIWHLVRFQS
jgi:hypothetical protein